MTEDVCALVVSVEAEEGNQEHVIMYVRPCTADRLC
jgi:hypothetical protein